jgi:hypothetical protein
MRFENFTFCNSCTKSWWNIHTILHIDLFWTALYPHGFKSLELFRTGQQAISCNPMIVLHWRSKVSETAGAWFKTRQICPPINRNCWSSKKHRQIAMTMPFVYVFATHTPDGGKPVTWRSPQRLQLLFVRYMKWLIEERVESGLETQLIIMYSWWNFSKLF